MKIKDNQYKQGTMAYMGLVLVLALLGADAAQAQWVDTGAIANGSFEADPYGLDPGYTTGYSGWESDNTPHYVLNSASTPFFYTPSLGPIPDGTYVGGCQGGGILWQHVPGLVDGQRYRLDFYTNLRDIPGSSMQLKVTINGQPLLGPYQPVPTTNPFQFHQYEFTYNAAAFNADVLELLFEFPVGDATILVDDFRVYTPATYAIGYSPDPAAGGSVSGPSSINHSGTYADTATVTATPNAGYSVASVTATNGSVTPAGGDNYTLSGVTANTTVTANFSGNAYTVTFDENGGQTPSPTSKSVTFASSYGTLATVARSGYTFDGWFTAASGGTEVTTATTVTTTSDHTLYAHWSVDSYTVTFNANGGGAPSPASKSVTYDAAYGTLANTSRTGYAFDGWFTATSGGTEVTDATTVSTSSDHTLYAQWTPDSYTVTFDANGGEAPSPASKSVTYDAAYGTLAITSRTGYIFEGWFTAASGGTEVTSATTVSTASDHTLYAQWTPDSYTVTFDENGGEAPSPASKSVTYDAAYGTLAAVARPGYTFDGWFTAASGGTEVTSATTVSTASDHTLYAQWTSTSYTVTFDENGGETPTPASKSVTYDAAYGTLAAVARPGYTFDGWFTAASGGTEVTDATTVSIASDHTLYAQWTPDSYTVTFDENGGEAPSPASKSVTYDAAYGTLATTSRTGYIFEGWFTAASGGTEVTEVTTVSAASDHTLYAQWTAASYTVTFDENGGDAPSPASKSVTYDAAYGTLANTSRTGYIFDGWFTAASGGTEVTETTTVSAASDHTLYAQWSPGQLPVTYAGSPAEGGIVSGPAAIAPAGETGDAISVTVTPNLGWILTGISATNGSVSVVAGDEYTLSGVTQATTVTAVFEEVGSRDLPQEGAEKMPVAGLAGLAATASALALAGVAAFKRRR